MINKLIYTFIFIAGIIASLIFGVYSYQIKNYTNKFAYQNSGFDYTLTKNRELLLFAIKYEIFINKKENLDTYINLINQESRNYSTVNFLKFYNSLSNFEKKSITLEKLLIDLHNARKFHRYNESLIHIATQIYAHTDKKDLFLESIGDIFYKNIKYSLGFFLERDMVVVSIVKGNSSGVVLDFLNKKINIQLSEYDAKYFFLNAMESYSCDAAVGYIQGDLARNFKLFSSNTIPHKRQQDISLQLMKSLKFISSMCQPRAFVF